MSEVVSGLQWREYLWSTSVTWIQHRNITNTQKSPNTISKFFADKQFEIYPDLSDCWCYLVGAYIYRSQTTPKIIAWIWEIWYRIKHSTELQWVWIALPKQRKFSESILGSINWFPQISTTGGLYIRAEIERWVSGPEIRFSIMLGRDHTSKYVGDRLSKYVALKRIDSCREGEIFWKGLWNVCSTVGYFIAQPFHQTDYYLASPGHLWQKCPSSRKRRLFLHGE